MKPETLSAGIKDAAPTRKLPLPVPTISKRPSPVSAWAVKLRGTSTKPAPSAGARTVWRSPGFGPQTRLTFTFAPAPPESATCPA